MVAIATRSSRSNSARRPGTSTCNIRPTDNATILYIARRHGCKSGSFNPSTLALAPLSVIKAAPRKGRASGYGLLNLRADWNDVGGMLLDLSMFATNVTNKTYFNLMASNYNSPGFNFGSLGQPRFIGVQGCYLF